MTPKQEALLGEALAHAYALREVVATVLANFIPREQLESLAAGADRAAAEIGPDPNSGMDQGIQIRVASLYRQSIKLSDMIAATRTLEALSIEGRPQN